MWQGNKEPGEGVCVSSLTSKNGSFELRLRASRILPAHLLILLFALFGLPADAQYAVDKVVVVKHDRTLQLLSHGRALKTYKVALGTEPIGPKQKQGDHRTPEGVYVLDSRNARSRFYKAIHISYPNQQDKARAAAAHVAPGGDVFIHGLPNGYGAIGAAHRLRDWTDGCIAVTDSEMDEIWNLVKNGTTIELKP
jgi:murein L,D-transpeptidase YafK